MAYTQLTLQERYVIYHLRLFGLTFREIGRRLNRHHTTIGREVERNRPRYFDSVYWHEWAQTQAIQRRCKPRHERKRDISGLVEYVERGLHADWPPEAIAGRLCIDYPQDQRMRISTETIYRWVYRDASKGGLFYTCLRWQHKKCRVQKDYGTGRGLIPGRTGIAERPAIVALRERFGDWEGDTVEGAKGLGHIASHVERKSRYLVAAKLANKTAEAMASASIAAFHRIPRALRMTLTVDNGKEFARFKQIEMQTGLSIYFADPYAAWQRGCNENTNGLLRRYFPKGCDFSAVSDEALALTVKKLNDRPRKCLDYWTPHEVFLQAKRGALGM
jgi:transposase, IS30 family